MNLWHEFPCPQTAGTMLAISALAYVPVELKATQSSPVGEGGCRLASEGRPRDSRGERKSEVLARPWRS